MQLSKRVIQLAKDRALYGFAQLAQAMLQQGRFMLDRPSPELRSAVDTRAMRDAHQFLLREGDQFLERLVAFYTDHLERAMQTMYNDLRAGMRNVSADRLSLIDDETMNRQIEVDRLVVRMRDADNENLGRINLMIAQLHGEHDIRERENPFRPYLIARSLHEVIARMVRDEATGRALFLAMSEVLVARLPQMYGGIRDVFESNGVRSRLVARPAAATRRQRALADRAALLGETLPHAGYEDEEAIVEATNHRVHAGLRRLGEVQPAPGEREGAPSLQEFVWSVFNENRPAAMPHAQAPAAAAAPGATPSPGRASALAMTEEMLGLQRRNADAQAGVPGEGAEEVRRRLADADLPSEERMTAEVVALMFDLIGADELIPLPLRGELARLQVPMMRAAMLSPDLLKAPSHPARVFMNRLGGVAAALDVGAEGDRAIATEIGITIDRILERFEDDVAMFGQCREEFEDFLVAHYRDTDPRGQARAEAMDEAERNAVVRHNLANAVHDMLQPLGLEQRVQAFILDTWVPAFAAIMLRAGHDEALMVQYRNVLPELAWSVTPKSTVPERSALMKLLPDLVRRLRKGMELAGLMPPEIDGALDGLADVHMRVLRMAAQADVQAMSLDALYRHFALLQVCEGSHLWTEQEPLAVPSEGVRKAFAARRLDVELRVQSDPIAPLATDAEWMAQMQLGIGADVQVGEDFELARLVWVSEQRSLFAFQPEKGGAPMVFSAISLLKSIRDGVLRPIEHAPLFERSAEALLTRAGTT